jgi:hypothetical protein
MVGMLEIVIEHQIELLHLIGVRASSTMPQTNASNRNIGLYTGKNNSNSVSIQQNLSKNYRAPSQVPQIYYTVVGCPIN